MLLFYRCIQIENKAVEVATITWQKSEPENSSPKVQTLEITIEELELLSLGKKVPFVKRANFKIVFQE